MHRHSSISELLGTVKQRLLISLLLGVVALMATALVASAHGENAQEGFLRMETVTFSNVVFSKDTIKQGEDITITGKATLLDTWPKTLGEPTTGFVNITAPGPVMLMKDRQVNGMAAPDAIFVKKGNSYDFKLTLTGREPGRWHVHPTFAVEGAGTLIGPGQWITVQDTGGFTNNLTLLNGQTVNLETYGVGQMSIFQWLGFGLGMAWMLYWTVPAIGGANHRTVSKLPVTLRVPLNTDGQDIGLITKQDHRISNLLLLATAALLIVGWVYQTVSFPIKIPQQVFRFTPPDLPVAPQLATAITKDATFDPATSTLVMNVDVTNTSKSPVTLKGFTTSSLTFVDQASAGTGSEHVMVIAPQGTINPGETKTLNLTLRDPVWRDARMIEVNRPRIEVAGQLLFQDASGTQSQTTIATSVNPKLI
jgi:methane/ammonia monooxygenase subunit B